MALARAAAKERAGHWIRLRRHEVSAWLWPESGAVSPIPSLDGLRAAAVVLVMLFHAWFYIPGVPFRSDLSSFPIYYGRTGVQLFFVLSGFLLFLPYARWIFGLQSQPSALQFYKRRILRVGPAYWMVLIILVCVHPITRFAIMDALLHVVFLANISPDTMYQINGVFWTMAVEVQFYALLPLIGWGAYALRQRVRPGMAVTIVVACLSLISVASIAVEDLQSAHRIPPAPPLLLGWPSLSYWIGVFGIGIGCSVIYTYSTRIRRSSALQAARLQKGAGRVLLGGILVGLAFTFLPPLHSFPFIHLVYGWVYGAVLYGILFAQSPLRRLLESRVARFIGLISYSIYLWQTVVMDVIEKRMYGLTSTPARIAVGFVLEVALTIPLAYVSYQVAERPFFKARQRAHEPAAIERDEGALSQPRRARGIRALRESRSLALAGGVIPDSSHDFVAHSALTDGEPSHDEP